MSLITVIVAAHLVLQNKMGPGFSFYLASTLFTWSYRHYNNKHVFLSILSILCINCRNPTNQSSTVVFCTLFVKIIELINNNGNKDICLQWSSIFRPIDVRPVTHAHTSNFVIKSSLTLSILHHAYLTLLSCSQPTGSSSLLAFCTFLNVTSPIQFTYSSLNIYESIYESLSISYLYIYIYLV